MKKLLQTGGVAAASLLLVGCTGEVVEKTAAGVTAKTVEVAKGTATGIDEGIEQGRKAAKSADGAVIVSTREEFAQHITAEVLSVGPGRHNGRSEVVVGFANDGDAPVRVTELDEAVMVIDKKGYVVKPAEVPHTFTVPYQAKWKESYTFACAPGDVASFRIHGATAEVSSDIVRIPVFDTENVPKPEK
jgi:hypothetical protein